MKPHRIHPPSAASAIVILGIAALATTGCATRPPDPDDIPAAPNPHPGSRYTQGTPERKMPKRTSAPSRGLHLPRDLDPKAST